MFIASCAEEPLVQLGDGFQYVRSSGTVHSIAKPTGESLIYGDVQDVNDRGQYITGLRVPADPSIRFPEGFADQPYGYFVYDKKTDRLVSGLSGKEFKKISEGFPENKH